MRFVPKVKVSVRASLTFAILLAILFSWILSSGIANYLNYLSILSIRKEMIRYRGNGMIMIPKPRFGIMEFLTGRPPIPPFIFRNPPPPQQDGMPAMPPPFPGANRRPIPPRLERYQPASFWETRQWLDLKITLLRLLIAFGLAGLTGALLGRRYAKPLMQLSKGAEAFHAGKFDYRIPSSGQDEFTEVAHVMNDMAEKVAEQISNLEQEAERRRRFLADIAHELRSPVTTMRTMAGALKDGVAEQPERRERAVTALVGTSERLLRLVQDLMELAKLDLNELPLNKAEINLCELIQNLLQYHQEEAFAAGILILPFQCDESVNIKVDPDRITQVLDNIIGNAISYAGKGARLSVTLTNEDPIHIVINDTGKGIRSQDLPYIFESFYRADQARTPGEAHSGLGLSIARKLTEAHGGTLTISSEEGKGTEVDIHLPKEVSG